MKSWKYFVKPTDYVDKTKAMKKLSIILNLYFVFIAVAAYGQSNPDYKIGIKDYHSAAVSSVVTTKGGKYFISGDETGKVLMFDTETFEFVKTVREASNIPVSSLQLTHHDSLLIISQRYKFGFDRKLDSIIPLNLYTGKTIEKQASVDFIKSDVEDLLIIQNHGVRPLKDLIEITHADFSPICKFIVESRLKTISVSHDIKKVAYVEQGYDNTEALKILDIKTAEVIRSIKIPDKLFILTVFFDKKTNDLFALVSNSKDSVSFFNLTADASWTNPVYSTSYYSNKLDKVLVNYIDDKYVISVTSSGILPARPLVFIKDKSTFISQIPALPKGAAKSLFIPEKKEILFFHPFSEHSNSIASFTVYDYEKNKIKAEYPTNSRKFYKGIFMPNGDWMVMGEELTNKNGFSSYDKQIKYFSKGTFQNRFDKLGLKNYLEVNAGIHALSGRIFHFDKTTGVHAFYGYKANTTETNPSHFYKYNFMTDKVSTITTIQTDYRVIADYVDATNLLLLSNNAYFNHGINESVKFELVNGNKIIKLPGDYKFGKFSNDGEYLLTISKDNLAELKLIAEDKTVFTKPLTEGSYKLFAVDESNFIISNSFRVIDLDKCNKGSLVIEIENGIAKDKILPCVIVDDVTSAGEKTAIIFENFGVIIGNKKMAFSQSEFPKAVSFNADASKMMLSLSNGKIVLYDTNTLKELGMMIHPNKATHIFYNEENHYFSNTPAEDYLYVTKNNNPVPLSSVEKQLYRPDKILAMFGEPNQEYLKTLEKALAIRANNKDFSVEETPAKPKNEPQIISTDKPELYFVSIGVSDYEQSDYDLTFADKDAMDMATIYGQLTDKDLFDYKAKFFGHHYSLYDTDETVQFKLNKYLDNYESTRDLYALNPEATLWLEDGYDSYTIWDLNKQTIEPIVLSENFSLSYNIYDPIFIIPDGSGFYFRDSNENYFKYSFEKKTFNKIKLPFEVIDDQHQPVGNEEWLKFEYDSDSIKISIGKINSSKHTKTISFPINTYKKLEADGSYKQITEGYYFNPNFKSASPNGKYMTYRVNSGELFYVPLEEPNPLSILIPLEEKVEYSDEVTIEMEGKTFCITEKLNEAYRFKSERFDLSGKKLQSLVLKDPGYKVKGFTVYNANPNYIKEAPPMVANNDLFGEDKVLETTKPYAFEKVHVKYLVDKEANSKEITKTLNSFFKYARPQDQVMLFLAGHGVLDKKYNYYFAPHDMDFKAISKNGIAFQTIVESLKTSPATNKLLLMDSCHSGNTLDLIGESDIIATSGPENGKRGSKATSTSKKGDFKVSDIVKSLFEDFLSKSGVTIISASTGGDLAIEGIDPTRQPYYGNGAFTYSYIKTLKEKMKGSSLYLSDEKTLKKEVPLTDGFITEVLKKVVVLTKGKQVPDLREDNEMVNIKLW